MNNWTIRKVTKCESTNNMVKELRATGKISDKTALMTEFQSAGRGQDKNNWQSNAGENLLVSLFMKIALPAEKYFLLNIMTSIAITELLKEKGINAMIKWPNDIYIGNEKLAGTLIENSLISGTVTNTIVGIGLNVNQTEFPKWLPNPISMALVTVKQYVIEDILDLLLRKIDLVFELIEKGKEEELYNQYTELLYRKGIWSEYLMDESKILGKIRGVLPDGRLIMELKNGGIKHFQFGEIRFLQ